MYFGSKSYLKSTRNHTAKHAKSLTEKRKILIVMQQVSSSFFNIKKYLNIFLLKK
jgi:hypothetical protein